MFATRILSMLMKMAGRYFLSNVGHRPARSGMKNELMVDVRHSQYTRSVVSSSSTTRPRLSRLPKCPLSISSTAPPPAAVPLGFAASLFADGPSFLCVLPPFLAGSLGAFLCDLACLLTG